MATTEIDTDVLAALLKQQLGVSAAMVKHLAAIEKRVKTGLDNLEDKSEAMDWKLWELYQMGLSIGQANPVAGPIKEENKK